MASVLPSTILDDLTDRLNLALNGNAVTDSAVDVLPGPPDTMPAQLTCWLRYGPVSHEWGTLTVTVPEIAVWLAVPSGDYLTDYRLITDLAHLIVCALPSRDPLGGEAFITDVRIEEAGRIAWAGTTDRFLMATQVRIVLQTKEELYV